jgi:hypothetical protein
MDLGSLRNHLLGWARDELASQGRLSALLELQELAAVAHDVEQVKEHTAALQAELGRAPRRAERRGTVIQALASHWNVSAGQLTLTSIAERLGPEGDPLRQVRSDLRDMAARVARQVRRLGRLLSVHRQLARETIEILLTDEKGNPLHDEGTLVDAEV